MVLYHGTTLERWHQINNEGQINLASADNSPYANEVEERRTEYGYVYLVGNVEEAIDFASKHCQTVDPGNRALMAILEVKVDEALLGIDPDETGRNTTIRAERSKFTHKQIGPYYRVDHPVNLERSLHRVALVDSAGFIDVSYVLQSDNIDDTIQRLRWMSREESNQNLYNYLGVAVIPTGYPSFSCEAPVGRCEQIYRDMGIWEHYK